jgi:hypothetical protein
VRRSHIEAAGDYLTDATPKGKIGDLISALHKKAMTLDDIQDFLDVARNAASASLWHVKWKYGFQDIVKGKNRDGKTTWKLASLTRGIQGTNGAKPAKGRAKVQPATPAPAATRQRTKAAPATPAPVTPAKRVRQRVSA